MKIVTIGEFHAGGFGVRSLKKNQWYLFKGRKKITGLPNANWLFYIEDIKVNKKQFSEPFTKVQGTITFRHAPLFNYKGALLGQAPQKAGEFISKTIDLKQLRVEDFIVYSITQEELIKMAPKFLAELL